MTLLQIRKGTDAYFVFILYNQIKYNKNVIERSVYIRSKYEFFSFKFVIRFGTNI